MRHKKIGGTVVPPSDFQSVTTKGTDLQRVTAKILRPHGCPRTRRRKGSGLFLTLLRLIYKTL